jgi:diketogulonate reductase-like aldo/keto reductase
MTAPNQTTETIEVQGVSVPRLGFGTWQIEGSEATEAVRDALEIGYRQIDTARAYGNESEVGEGIAQSGVDREQIFLTTKIFPGDFEPDALKAAAEDSLHSLRTDYLDLLLLHWPDESVPIERTMRALDELREAGRIRRLGVSNFPAGLLEQALEHAPVFCDQVEYHPFLEQERLLDQDHVSPIPKASNHERRVENFEVFDFELSAEERAEIDALPKDVRTAEPPWAPDWDA